VKKSYKNTKINLYITKDLNHLFLGKIDNTNVYGFDILNNSSYVCFPKDELIIVSSENKLFSCLLKDEKVKLELAEISCRSCNQQTEFLGISKRTLLRMKSNLK
jgi:hypothetical protein